MLIGILVRYVMSTPVVRGAVIFSMGGGGGWGIPRTIARTNLFSSQQKPSIIASHWM